MCEHLIGVSGTISQIQCQCGQGLRQCQCGQGLRQCQCGQGLRQCQCGQGLRQCQCGQGLRQCQCGQGLRQCQCGQGLRQCQCGQGLRQCQCGQDTNDCRNATLYNCAPEASCVNDTGTFNCSCNDGYTGDGFNCTDLNECTNSLHNCSQYATCHNFVPGFNCTCREGFTGDGVNCADIDECSNATLNNCAPEASCTNVAGTFNCSCKAGYIGNGFNCTDLNECTNSLHNCSQYATCHNFVPGFNCTCREGFTGDGVNCADLNECTNSLHNCSQYATCHNFVPGFNCTCREGFTGDGVNCADLNECTNSLHNCSQYATCHNFVPGFNCTCREGFTGDGVNCADLNECTNSLHNCSQYATCHNFVPGFNCTCREGFTGDGVNCADLNECTNSLHNCSQYATCHNFVPGFNCTCREGFTGDGVNCTDLNECTNSLHNCSQYATCHNFVPGFNCTCREGFTGDGVNCADIDECSNATLSNCAPEASCTNVAGTFNCSCKAGYIGNGFNCTDLNECTNSLHNCSQYATCHNFVPGFNCTCKEGFTGDGVNCADIDECSNAALSNCAPEASCMNVAGTFNCSCKAGYIGNGFNCTDVNECSNNSPNNCSPNADCHNFDGGYNCSCKSGFTGDGASCKDVDECLQMNYPCSNLATCKNTVGKFVYIDECSDQTDTCSEFANCINNFGGYSCACNDGFVGDGFKCLEKPMVDYKTEVPVKQNELYGPYFINLKITVFNLIYQNIYVSVNGYIAFGEKSYAQPDGTFPAASPVLAPFWTAFDVAAPGKIFIDSYEYCKDKAILNRIGNMISSAFHAKHAVVVTWENLSPYPASEFGNETITFQSILVSNGTFFYAIFNYDKDNVKLNAEANRDILVGYGDGKGGSTVFAQDKIFFNLLEAGNEVYGLRKTFKMGNRTESSLNCLEWHCKSEKQFHIDSFAIPCPCTLQQAQLDLTFKGVTGNTCYENRFPINGTIQRCCYSQAEKALLKDYPDGGFIYNTNGSFSDGQQYCCKDYPLCNLFYDIHPSDTCSKYQVPGTARVEMEDNDQFSKIPVYTAFAIKSENAVLEISEKGNVLIENNTDNIFEKENNTIFFNNMHLEIISVNDSMGIILTLPHYLQQPYLLSGLLTGKMPNGQAIDPSSERDVYRIWEACRVKEKDSLLNYTHKNYSSFNSYSISEDQFIEILSNLTNLVNSINTTCQDNDMFCVCAAVLHKPNLANHTMLYKPEYFERIENFPPFLQDTMNELYLTSGNNTIFLEAADRNNDSINLEIEVNNSKNTFDSSNLNWTLNLDGSPTELKVWAKDSRGATSLYWPEIFFCTYKDFCSKGVCSQKCKDNIGDTYVCSCRNGYKLAADNKTCEDIDECAMPSKCSGFGEYCFNVPGSFQCKCKTGYVSNNGTCEILANKNKFSGSMSINLRDITQIQMAKKLADKSSAEYKTTSEEMKKSILDKIGTDNVVVIDDIVTDKSNRTKRSTDPESLKVLYTVYGNAINQTQLENLLKSSCGVDCCNFNGLCVAPNSLQINAQDMCNENICDSMSTNCTQEEKGFRCVCKPGFETSPQYDLFKCKDIDECNTIQPCGSIPCSNTFGGYKCLCKSGHVFKNKSKSCVDVCAGHRCKKGDCVKLEESYRCSCHDYWTGKYCDKELEEKESFRTAAIVIGVVLGILCLLLIGVIVYIIRKYKNPSKTGGNLTDPAELRSSKKVDDKGIDMSYVKAD
ncbi:von Willebrand factor type A, EGF and pentraxin domain-containing 1-like [Octopus vulgaris]|uniref:von Willebrand factor type A, EGF and pentraxin domain-containing 1-like n=1 Tax=Octopus vulgaris TaxID=6645 RepID=A0AA36F5F4_OCTVU|nr:von Willebrand factor type A, EGF and pentraxin domain-containing 1-like [Octopus vulgaris]